MPKFSGLLANENIAAPAIAVLRARGVDVIAVRETMQGASDRQVLEVARGQVAGW